MDANELLELYLSEFPASAHPCDMKRFVRWAIAAHRSELSFPERKFRERMDDEDVRYFHIAFDVVGYTLAGLDE